MDSGLAKFVTALSPTGNVLTVTADAGTVTGGFVVPTKIDGFSTGITGAGVGVTIGGFSTGIVNVICWIGATGFGGAGAYWIIGFGGTYPHGVAPGVTNPAPVGFMIGARAGAAIAPSRCDAYILSAPRQH